MCDQKHNNVPIDYLYVCQSCGEEEHAEAMGNDNSICQLDPPEKQDRKRLYWM